MPWGVAAAAVGSVIASGNAADAQNHATDAATASANDANALNRDEFNWNKTNYETNVLPQQQKTQAIQDQIAQQSLDSSKQQQQFSADQQQYYKDTFQPVEKQMVDDANNYDSQANVDKKSGIAAANVNQQFSNAQDQSARLAGRYGLGSTAFSGQAGQAQRAQALGTAGAATGAAFDTQDKAIALRAGAANFGRNMPNTSAQFGGLSNQSGSVGSGAAGAALGSTIAGGNVMSTANQQNIGNTLGIGGALAGAYQTSANAFNAQAGGFGSLAGGILGNKTAQTTIQNGVSGIGDWFKGLTAPANSGGYSNPEF